MQKLGKHPLSTESGATGMGKWAQALGGTGLLEMNIGRNGISMQLGMNGIDVGGALYDLGKRSYDKSMLQRYEREHGKDKGEAAYSAYVYGDWTQEHTAARLASGKDELYFSGGKEYTAKTSSNGKGGRRIEITDSKDRRLNAIQLGHEAYRDGIVGGNNAQETIAAVLGHTGMAVRMEADGKTVAGSDLLRAEMEAYKRGDMSTLAMHALTNYDSTDDYWKVTKDKKGKILKIENDNSNDITYVDEYGYTIGTEAYKGGSKTQFIADKLGMSKEEANRMLTNAGYTYNLNTDFFEGKNAKQAFDITGLLEMNVGAEKQGNWGIYVAGEAKQFFDTAGKKVSSGLTRFGNKMGNTFDWIFKRGIYSKGYELLKGKYDSVEGLPYSANKSDWRMDSKSILTADSKGLNCIGFVTYMYGIEAKYSVENFEKYPDFKKLNRIKSFKNLQIGDVIRWRGVMTDGVRNNHIQIYAGNGYVWESADSSMKNGVRYWEFSKMLNYYKNPKNIKQETLMIDYFRFKKEEAQK